MTQTNALYYLLGKPSAQANLKTHNSDFIVKEILPFEPTGEGEHHLLHIQKDGLNTIQVADKLAKFAGIHSKDVSFAGQKDKYAVTQQWFGVRIPGKETPEWSQLNSTDLSILSAHRHTKKLRTGALVGNRFKLTLREVSDIEDVKLRIEQVSHQGVPNYFGEQRFGNGGRNLIQGRQMLAGRKVKDRNKRSMYLSAVRSYLFNQCVSQRLATHSHAKLAGDCVMLSGSKSYFVADSWDETNCKRLLEKDIQLSAPLWGKGDMLSKGEAAQFEKSVLSEFEQDCEGLAQAGLQQERRPMIVEPQGLKYVVEDNVLTLEFVLPSGCYATSVLRELFDYQDMSKQPQPSTDNA
ncbi:tRNA pseudouridine(13) synthase TruD [Shewanella gelidii]|uniref:tRNA pseudouridine synthase D n=1 Tax=Shewanella gelidii TaxID=1642821 RepID=A0A917N601_9GAMM|nr:tRNA pseudouridine(13) synthase TruD [Shewanella gelidii]MCL1096588.1 tRNA pseudouridine(13) synthase TruD [Shewanella gelidii]GGI68642.1 tRNA pseudouridine synthase D [Shewanella gelidii]